MLCVLIYNSFPFCSKDSGEHSDLTRIPVPVQLFRWCSPEIILEKPGTVKSDVFSFCAVLQEALTGESTLWAVMVKLKKGTGENPQKLMTITKIIGNFCKYDQKIKNCVATG